jgi:hypothetical protein
MELPLREQVFVCLTRLTPTPALKLVQTPLAHGLKIALGSMKEE